MESIISKIVSMIAGVFVRRGVKTAMDRTIGSSKPARGEGGGGDREAEKSARRAAKQARKATKIAGKF